VRFFQKTKEKTGKKEKKTIYKPVGAKMQGCSASG
jgi:hypothetical protein